VKATDSTDRPRAVGYVRVSTVIQASEGESLKTQRKQIEEYAAAKGLELLRIYEDAGISGSKTTNRPALNELMHDCRTNGAFQYVIITKLSRFARNTRNFLEYRDELKTHRVNIVSIQENIDASTHTGELMLTLLAAVAQWERDVIREQMAENKMAKWADHRCFIGKPPFGYLWNKETKQLKIDKREAEIYHRIVTMYIEQGFGYRDIESQFRKEGIRCKKAPFSNTDVTLDLW
jgi:site-specific DNA recombinase